MGYWKSDYDFSFDIVNAVQADYDAKVAREIAESESEAEQAALEAQLAEEQAQCVDYQKSEIADYLKNQLDVALRMLTYMRDSYFPPAEINTIISTVQRLKLEFNQLAANADKRIVEKAYHEFCTLPF